MAELMNAGRYRAGDTFESFVASATKYRDLWTVGTKHASVPEEIVAELQRVTQRLHLVNLNADWCFDAISTMPAVARLAARMPAAEFRVFDRDANLDIMEAHLTNGTRSIPLVIVYDEGWNELGWWGPRPAPLQEWFLSGGRNLPSDEKYRYIRQWYARDRARTTLREVADLILRSAGATTG